MTLIDGPTIIRRQEKVAAGLHKIASHIWAIGHNGYLLGGTSERELLKITPKDKPKENFMARRCAISGVTHQNGNRVSHANNKSHHKFESNLQTKKIFVPELGKSVRVKVSTRMLRTIDKLGLMGALQKFNVDLRDVAK